MRCNNLSCIRLSTESLPSGTNPSIRQRTIVHADCRVPIRSVHDGRRYNVRWRWRHGTGRLSRLVNTILLYLLYINGIYGIWIDWIYYRVRINSYCSKGKRVCQGQPCYVASTTPVPVTRPTLSTTTAREMSASTCRTSWSDWINSQHPKEGGDVNDFEPIPDQLHPVFIAKNLINKTN